MARPIRQSLKFDEASVNKLLQEIYNESHNIKNKLARLFSKWETKVKEGGEIQAIGDQIVKIINAEAKNQDQKIMLLKYLKEVVFVDKNANANNNQQNKDNNVDENGEVTSARRNELLNFVSEEMEKRGKKK